MTEVATSPRPQRRRELALLLVGSLALAAATVHAQIQQVGGSGFLDTEQVIRHASVMSTHGPYSLDPWPYRLLSDYSVDALFRAYRALDFSHAERMAFIHFRFLQNAAIFLLAYAYFRRLGLRAVAAALGLGLLAWGLTQASGGSDIKFDTYGDVIFYLAGAIVILRGPDGWPWLVPLVALAATNRETSGAIPLLMLGVAAQSGLRSPRGRWALTVAGAALLAFGGVYLTIRGIIGSRPPFIAFGHHPGSELLDYNTGNKGEGWHRLFLTLNVFPILCWWGFRRWPAELRAFGLALVPLWVIVHFLAAVVAETRLFLVPDALVFIPGTLILVAGTEESATLERARRRLRLPFGLSGVTVAAIAGAVMLMISLFGDWYELRRPGFPSEMVSGWSYLHSAKLLIVVLAVAAVAVVLVPRLPAWWRAIGLTVVGAAATGVVLRQVLATPGIDDTVRSRWAAYVALVAAWLLLIAGAVEVLRRVVRPGQALTTRS